MAGVLSRTRPFAPVAEDYAKAADASGYSGQMRPRERARLFHVTRFWASVKHTNRRS